MSQIMMTKALKQLLRPIRTQRNYSQRIAVATRDGSSNPAQQVPRTKLVQYPYYVPRNTRGSLPVYSEIRNNGTRVQVLIRNIDGNAETLAKDLTTALLEKGVPNATRMKVMVKSRLLVLQGGYWKNDVMNWLIARGF